VLSVRKQGPLHASAEGLLVVESIERCPSDHRGGIPRGSVVGELSRTPHRA
jgi:hypothetical protein